MCHWFTWPASVSVINQRDLLSKKSQWHPLLLKSYDASDAAGKFALGSICWALWCFPTGNPNFRPQGDGAQTTEPLSSQMLTRLYKYAISTLVLWSTDYVKGLLTMVNINLSQWKNMQVEAKALLIVVAKVFHCPKLTKWTDTYWTKAGNVCCFGFCSPIKEEKVFIIQLY